MRRILGPILLLLLSVTSMAAEGAHAQEDACEVVLHDTLGMMIPCSSGAPSTHGICEAVVHGQLGMMIPCPP